MGEQQTLIVQVLLQIPVRVPGKSSGGDFLWFPQGSTVPRVARTIQMAVPAGGTIFFEFKMEAQSAPGCDGPDQVNEGVFLQYNVGGMAGFTNKPSSI